MTERFKRVCAEEGCGWELPPRHKHRGKFCFTHSHRGPLPRGGRDPEKAKLVMNRYRKKRYARLRAAGVCCFWACRSLSGGHVYCAAHSEYVNRMRRLYRKRSKG